MFYRETGQFKTSYVADSQIFPIRQDRIGVGLVLAVAFLMVPLVASEYWFSALLIPFLVFALAALGLNILTGYCGQLSLGSAAFMAVGAYAAYNFQLRIEGMPILLSFVLGGIDCISKESRMRIVVVASEILQLAIRDQLWLRVMAHPAFVLIDDMGYSRIFRLEF